MINLIKYVSLFLKPSVLSLVHNEGILYLSVRIRLLDSDSYNSRYMYSVYIWTSCLSVYPLANHLQRRL